MRLKISNLKINSNLILNNKIKIFKGKILKLLFTSFCCFASLMASDAINCDNIKNNKTLLNESSNLDYLNIASSCKESLKNKILQKNSMQFPMKFAEAIALVMVWLICQNYNNLIFYY